MNITLSQAQATISAAQAKAAELETKMNIVIVDAGANIVALIRMDGSWLGSLDVATKKAKTAVWFQMNTEALSKMVQPGQDLYAIEHSNGGLITFPGGVVIKDAAGQVIGAIGVSGSTVKDDNKVAKAGAEAIGSQD